MHVLALYYFVGSCCVTILEQKVLCSVAIFQSSQRLNVLSLGCVFPTSTFGNQFMCPQLFRADSLCTFQNILCSNIACKSASPSHWNAGWNHISIPCFYSLHSKAPAAPEDCQILFLLMCSREDFKLRVT